MRTHLRSRLVRPRPARRAGVALAAGVLLLAGCGGDDGGGDADAAVSAEDTEGGDTSGDDTSSEAEPEPTASATADDTAEPTPGDEENDGESPTTGGGLPPIDNLSWFPAQEGTTWTYRQETGGQAIEQTQTLEAVEPGDDGTVMTISNTFDNGAPPFELEYVVRDDGSVAVPFQTFDAGAGAEVEASGDLVWLGPDQFAAGESEEGELVLDVDAGGQSTSADVTFVVEPQGVETVTVPAGEFEASHMRIDLTIDTQGVTQDLGIDLWFVQGVGFVKQAVDALGQTLDVELVTFDPAG